MFFRKPKPEPLRIEMNDEFRRKFRMRAKVKGFTDEEIDRALKVFEEESKKIDN